MVARGACLWRTLRLLLPAMVALSLAHATPKPPMLAPVTTLTWDGTGDFGPHTAGTRTSGWQEALDYATANSRDMYVQGHLRQRSRESGVFRRCADPHPTEPGLAGS